MAETSRREEQAAAPARTASPSPLRIGELLSRNGHIDPSDLALALSEQDLTSNSPPLGRILVGLGVIDEETLTATLAEQFGMRIVDLAHEASPDPSALARLTREAAHRLQALPLRYEDGELLVVVAEPPSRATKREIVTLSSRQPAFVLSSATTLVRALDEWYPHPTTVVEAPRQDLTFVLDVEPPRDDDRPHEPSPSYHGDDRVDVAEHETPGPRDGIHVDDRVIAWLLSHATDLGATSVHLLEEPAKVRVRVRVDGKMWETKQLPPAAGTILVRRILAASGIRSEATAVLSSSIPAVPGSRQEWHVRSIGRPPRRAVILRAARPIA